MSVFSTKFNVDDLVEQGLVVKKTYKEGKYKGLSILKYHRQVFFKNLWHLDDRLLECRGIVVDEEDNIIVRPFKKVFNLFENGAGESLNYTDYVDFVIKLNGFMACVTVTEKYGTIVSTTGSLDSPYVELAKEWIDLDSFQYEDTAIPNTYTFEVCDNEKDPHIIEEDDGATLIGVREVHSGDLFTEDACDVIADLYGFKRPYHFAGMVGKVLESMPHRFKEGYMLRSKDSEGAVICKMKFPYYLSKKALQRCGKNKANMMFDNPSEFKKKLDEEFYDIFDKILETFTKEEYLSMTEQERRKWIEEYFNYDGS